MDKQLIISIGREYGSGGREIGRRLSELFGITYYDSSIIEEIEKKVNLDYNELKEYSEKPINKLFSRTINGFSSSIRENIAIMQFDFLKEQAKSGKSFVVIGRCSETVLAEYPGLITFFVTGDYDTKLARVMMRNEIDEDEARSRIKQMDWSRKSYHNYFSKGKWGDSRNYDMTINSSRLGIELTADIMKEYIKKRIELMQD